MPEDDGLACRGTVFADGVPIGMVDGTAGVTFEPDDGEGTWCCPLPFPELFASVELTPDALAVLGAAADGAADATFSLAVDVLRARLIPRGLSRADAARLRHQCRRSPRNLNLAMRGAAGRRPRLEFDVVRVALPAARIVSDGHEACAAGVPHGEAGARQYGAHYRQADARERPSEERPDTEND